jgi:hypothetical protein
MAPDHEIPELRHQGLAAKYAFFSFILSGLGAGLYMIAIQYLILKVRYIKSRAKPPSSLETGILVTALWLIHRLLDTVLNFTLGIFVLVSAPPGTLASYLVLRQDEYSLVSWAGCHTEWRGTALLYHEVISTWLLSRGILFCINTLVPLIRDHPQDLTLRFQMRCLELFYFFQAFNQNAPSTPDLHPRPRLGKVRSAGAGDLPTNVQAINLKRYQDETPKGQRTLSWDLTVDKQALDEMMETLGPPGGFGELGFSVSGDRVSFGAMGIGTRFNLTFVLENKERRNGALKDFDRRKSTSWMK